MKTEAKRMLMLSIGFAFCLLSAQNALAQCVKCDASGGGFSCVPSTNGGCRCVTAGAGCFIENPCSSSPGLPAPDCGGGSRAAENASTNGKVDIATLRDIGQQHPRFAVLLAALNLTGGVQKWAQFYLLPAPVDYSDVEFALYSPTATRMFFKKQMRKVPKGAEPLEYEFTREVIDNDRSVLRGKLIKGTIGDSAGAALEINFDGGKAVSWSIK